MDWEGAAKACYVTSCGVGRVTGEVTTLSYANFSQALVAGKVPALVGGGPSTEAGPSKEGVPLGTSVTVDYSTQPLSVSEDRRHEVAQALAKVPPPPPRFLPACLSSQKYGMKGRT